MSARPDERTLCRSSALLSLCSRSAPYGRCSLPLRSLLPAAVAALTAPLIEPSHDKVGVYGLPMAVKEKREFDMVKAMRCVEARLRETGSVQMLYADIFQTREEFEQMFPHDGYRKVRAKYHAEGAFPEPYDKMHVLGVTKEKRN